MRNKNSGFLTFVIAVISLIAGAAVTALYLGKGPSAGGSVTEDAVREVLEKNPQLIMDAFQKGRAQAQAEQMKKAKENVIANREKIENDAKAPITGNPKGNATVVEFFDYNCGYCKHVVPDVVKLLEEDKDVKFVFIDFPILGPTSEVAARAALAANLIDPSKYFAYHQALMEFQGQKTEEGVLEVAKKVGYAPEKIKEKMKSTEVSDHLKSNQELGRSIGISGTPAFVIAGNLVPGAIGLEEIKRMLQEARTQKTN